MAERLVAADASPLIGLAAAGGFDLLRSLFGQRASLVDSVRPFFERLAARDFRLWTNSFRSSSNKQAKRDATVRATGPPRLEAV